MPPAQKFYFECVNENDDIISRPILYQKGNYLIGRLAICDIMINDPTCSRQHAVIQFRTGDPDIETGERIDEAYIFDLGSTSGTYLNGDLLESLVYYPLYGGDKIRFGQYPCSYVLRTGNESNLIPPPVPMKEIKAQSENSNVVNHNDLKPKYDGVVAPSFVMAKGSKMNTLRGKKMIIQESSLNSDSQNDLVQLENASKAINEIISPSKAYAPLNFDYSSDEDCKFAASDTFANESEKESESTKLQQSEQFNDTPDSSAIEFNEEAYKLKMIAEYEEQQREHTAMLLQKRMKGSKKKDGKLKKKMLWWKR